MSLKKKEPTLANKISDLLTSVPKSYGSDEECEVTKAKVVDYDEEIDALSDFKREFNSSNIRTRNINLLEEADDRYQGRKVSKKEIFNQDDSLDESNDDDDVDDSMEGSTKENESDNENDDGSSQEDSVNMSENEEYDNESDNEENYSSLDISESQLNEEKDNTELSDEGEEKEANNDEDDVTGNSRAANSLLLDRRSKRGIKTMTAVNIRAEIEKANCVQEQLRVWENFLEIRIKLQKFLVNSNAMPQYDTYKTFESNDEFKSKCTELKSNLSELLNNLIQLQTNLVNNYSETKDLLTKSKKRKKTVEKESGSDYDTMDEEIPSDTEDDTNSVNESDGDSQVAEEEKRSNKTKESARKKIKLSEFEGVIDKNFKAYTDYRNATIQKWNDKTRIASGIINKRANQPALKQIEFLLANKEKLIKKTQLKRSQYDIIGKATESLDNDDGNRVQEYDTEIFDDDDFYHQLLRDLIEFKSSDITDPIQLSKQWVQLQNMRSKIKKKVDTKATKGRRIRYSVHQKLINLMAPMTTLDTWTDRAKDDLYNSLFGKTRLHSIKEPTST
ncbi:PREDICTED: protein Aatf [Ceratosolen solmsi marchali]|uniref:Protein Aatf n=1 Tax=Ceratosolen solmsi marchali TaxID=326594 RepID=A0AAJ6YIE1_9HYME|nr:PREDICTED: protein Aatf [Ceratosolen solmsi marchali]